ncbi:hypothetical protein PIB30_115339, partial [Stylosanthes scabra]|nr:hypothetical protein [Stylosanthes scabra]
MESGELMLRVNDESLVIQVYKPMHQSPPDSKLCLKVEKGDHIEQTLPDKKKEFEEDKGKSILIEDTPTTSDDPYSSVLVGSDNKTFSKD